MLSDTTHLLSIPGSFNPASGVCKIIALLAVAALAVLALGTNDVEMQSDVQSATTFLSSASNATGFGEALEASAKAWWQTLSVRSMRWVASEALNFFSH